VNIAGARGEQFSSLALEISFTTGEIKEGLRPAC
jgi:hypothetical protein